MYTLYKFHFLNGISEINQLFDDILIIWPAPVYCVFVLSLYSYQYFTSVRVLGYELHVIRWNKQILQSEHLFKLTQMFSREIKIVYST